MLDRPRVPYVDFPAEYERNRDKIIPAIEEVLKRGDFILGKEVEVFEKSFASLCGTRYAISVANGTDAIVMALKVLGVGVGDEVITAPNSWISTAAAIALAGATPVFADVEEDQNISPRAVEAAITDKTRAILPVHITGRCCRLSEILEIGKRQNIPVIEDAAQAVGAEENGIRAGAGGILGCFSLHPLKNLNAVGDAGIITSNNERIAYKLRLLRNHGLINRDESECWGYNSRLDTLQAAILLTRLPELKSYIECRRKNARKYTEALSHLVKCPQDSLDRPHTYHVYVIQTDRRDELREFLLVRGIESKVHYPIPIHLQKSARYLNYPNGSFPVVERQAKQILSLPIHPYLNNEQIDWVIESLREFFHGGFTS